MNESAVRSLWESYKKNEANPTPYDKWSPKEIYTESQFRQATGLTRETYILPRQEGYRGGSHVTSVYDPVSDIESGRAVRFFGASADGYWIMVVGMDGRTFAGIRRPYQLYAH